MEKVDFKRSMKALWQPAVGVFSLIDVPKLQFAMVDGKGDPNTSEEYRHAIEWLYSVSYPLKFMSKKELGKDYGVAPLEGLWWAESMSSFLTGEKDLWSWTMMIMQPDWITGEMFKAALGKARAKLGEQPVSLRLQSLHEGLSVQIMHIGPYSAEGPTILRLHEEFLPANGLVENGQHHEIYLGDPRKAAPEKLRTVIRQPVKKR